MKAFAVWLALAASILALPASGAQTKGAAMRNWDQKHPLPAGTAIGPFKVTSTRKTKAGDDDNGAVQVGFADGSGNAFSLKADIAFEDVLATVGAGRIDPDSAKPQLLLNTFTGGAHCCLHIQVADWIGGKWKIVDVGTFDGEPFDIFPHDVDGDGVADLVYYDDRFAYAFCAYACSWMPPRIFNIRKGKAADVSSQPRYRALFEKDYAAARKSCGDPEDGNAAACAGMVADGARLGRAAEAWTFALAHVQTDDDWTFPGCKVKADPAKGCPKAQAYRGKDFQISLTKFLAETGYTHTSAP